MAERAHYLSRTWWANTLEELDAEIARLAVLCRINLLQPGVIGRVLQKDATVCGSKNQVAFAKLHDLLLVHLAIGNKLVDAVGPTETAVIEAEIADRLRERFGDLLSF